MTEFLAIDGEALRDTGEYFLLCASDGTHIMNPQGLSTQECFEFLLSKTLPKKKGGAKRVIVCFGLNYDANMWLRDLAKDDLEFLWENGVTIYEPKPREAYRIEWIPGHWMKIQKAYGEAVFIYEVWGFFQSSFINALSDWGFPTAPEMEAMKAQRGDFTQKELDKIIRYCHSECESLVKLMVALESACRIAKVVPTRWLGAGSLAAKILNDRKYMKDHHVHDYTLGPEECQDAILRAYFGGRVEMFQQGEFRRVQAADIRSAYPHAITLLPSLNNGRLIHTTDYDPDCKHGIWKCEWRNLRGNLMPFPVRHKKDVYYPSSGLGWYHAVEVQAALSLGYKIKVLEGWVLRSEYGEDMQPFNWVQKVYDLRNEWKQQGLAAEKVLKLALNSMYGKLAQGIGYKSPYDLTDKETIPRWQSYFWAGEITARTRSRMLVAAYHSDNPIMIATDGLFCSRAAVTDSPELGGWEISEYDSLFVARPGVYLAERNGHLIYNDICRRCRKSAFKGNPRCKEHPTVTRSRGFDAREVDFYDLKDVYEQSGVTGEYRYDSHRFIGIGTALMRKDFSVWKTWEDKPRKLTFMPAAKKVNLHTNEITPYDLPLPESEPYVPKGKKDFVEDQVQFNEQPMKTGG